MSDVTELSAGLQRLADELNQGLIEDLVSKGALSSPAWRAAFEAIPRHWFAPRFTLPDNAGGQTLDVADSSHREVWLRAVYRNTALLTELEAHEIATTSCSAPSVVATMLEAGQAAEGDRVLEIGTGTGWTAGLLSNRLGSAAVSSVDISPKCVAEARERLQSLGLNPTLAIWDGYQGYEPGAPYDRIIATASLRQVPPAWLAQVRPGGTILVDLRGDFAGNLALLTVGADQSAEGCFLASGVNFMPLRSGHQPFDLLPELSSRAVNDTGEQRTVGLNPAVLRKRGFAFFAQVTMPGTQVGQVGIKGGARYFCLTDPASQAWARVELADETTERQVTQGGDRRLWDELEAAHEQWEQLGQPAPQDFTVSISEAGEQMARLPGVEAAWTLPM